MSPSGGCLGNISRGVVPTCLSHGQTLILRAASQQQVSRYTVVIPVNVDYVSSLRVDVPHAERYNLIFVEMML